MRNHTDVQDLAQQTFIKAHQKLPTLTKGTSFERWLYRIAENTARDYFRAKKRRPVLSSENLEEDY
ncbi:MAG TPA: sigma factor [Ktedonobacteraceae bacterium]|nr:sigma factor [Ktedonobacteraceae bacterium]